MPLAPALLPLRDREPSLESASLSSGAPSGADCPPVPSWDRTFPSSRRVRLVCWSHRAHARPASGRCNSPGYVIGVSPAKVIRPGSAKLIALSSGKVIHPGSGKVIHSSSGKVILLASRAA